MYEIIAIKRGIGITNRITTNELYVKLENKRYYILRSQFSKFNRKRLTRKIVDGKIAKESMILVYPELPKLSKTIYSYEI